MVFGEKTVREGKNEVLVKLSGTFHSKLSFCKRRICNTTKPVEGII